MKLTLREFLNYITRSYGARFIEEDYEFTSEELNKILFYKDKDGIEREIVALKVNKVENKIILEED